MSLWAHPDKIQKLFDGMEKEIKTIKSNCLKYGWYMRGGATYHDIMNMSNDDRELISELIKENLETTKTTQMPFF